MSHTIQLYSHVLAKFTLVSLFFSLLFRNKLQASTENGEKLC